MNSKGKDAPPKRKAGRPRKTLSAQQIELVEQMAAYLNVDQISDFLKINRDTFYAMMARDPEIFRRYKRGRASVVIDIAQSLISKARDGDTASMIFFLKTQAGWKETSGVDHTSSDGSMTPGGLQVPEKIEIIHVRPGENKDT